MAKGNLVTEAMVIGIFEQIKMSPEITNAELAAMWKRSEDTIRKIRRTGSPEGWKTEKKRKAELERQRAEERRMQAEARQAEAAEEQVPGQIRMEFPAKVYGCAPAPEPVKNINIIDQDKMMRFQAGQAERIVKAIEENAVMLNTMMDRLNDTMSMVLRAVRRE